MSGVRLAYVTTIPMSLGFFRGHVSHLKSRGFEIHAICSPGDTLEQFGSELGIAVHSVTMSRSVTPARDLRSAWGLWKIIREVKPDIVHAATPKAGLLGSLTARLASVPVVVTSLFGLPQMTKTGLMRRVLDASTSSSCRWADRVWCDSFSMRDYIARAGLCPAHKLFVLGKGSVGGVDAQNTFSPLLHGVDVRNAIRRRYGIPANARVLGFVGRIVHDKGMRELAAAWRVLREDYADLHLMLVGPFENGAPLRREDQCLFETDPRVHLAGERNDVPKYMAGMDVSVMPSYREGFGITNIEAAAMALPVVSTQIPGCADSVQNGATGMLVPPRDASALTEALRRYVEDPTIRRAHGGAGRQRVLRDFRPETIWKALHREYRHLLEAKGVLSTASWQREESSTKQGNQQRRAA